MSKAWLGSDSVGGLIVHFSGQSWVAGNVGDTAIHSVLIGLELSAASSNQSVSVNDFKASQCIG